MHSADRYRRVPFVVLVVPALLMAGCGGSSSNPTSPSPVATTPMATTPMTITIVGIDGSQSFSPDSAPVNAGQQVVWHNADPVNTHRIVQDSGAWDTGDLPPGATSAPVTIGTSSPMPYHCSIHPVMVGNINGGSSSSTPPCTGAYCS